MYVSSILKIEEVAAFIANMNKDATHHVGYCGDEKEELLQTIIHDFSDIGRNNLLLLLMRIII